MSKTDLGSQRKTHKTLNTCPIAMKLDSFECNGFSVFLTQKKKKRGFLVSLKSN